MRARVEANTITYNAAESRMRLEACEVAEEALDVYAEQMRRV